MVNVFKVLVCCRRADVLVSLSVGITWMRVAIPVPCAPTLLFKVAAQPSRRLQQSADSCRCVQQSADGCRCVQQSADSCRCVQQSARQTAVGVCNSRRQLSVCATVGTADSCRLQQSTPCPRQKYNDMTVCSVNSASPVFAKCDTCWPASRCFLRLLYNVPDAPLALTHL